MRSYVREAMGQILKWDAGDAIFCYDGTIGVYKQ